MKIKSKYFIFLTLTFLLSCRSVTQLSKNISAKKFKTTTWFYLKLSPDKEINLDGNKYITSITKESVEKTIRKGFKDKITALNAIVLDYLPVTIPDSVNAYEVVFSARLSEDLNKKKYTDEEKGYNNYPYTLIRCEIMSSTFINDLKTDSNITAKTFIINEREVLQTSSLPNASELSVNNSINNYIEDIGPNFGDLPKTLGQRIAIWSSKKLTKK